MASAGCRSCGGSPSDDLSPPLLTMGVSLIQEWSPESATPACTSTPAPDLRARSGRASRTPGHHCAGAPTTSTSPYRAGSAMGSRQVSGASIFASTPACSARRYWRLPPSSSSIGLPLVGQTLGSKGKPYHYYRCRHVYARVSGRQCAGRYVPAVRTSRIFDQIPASRISCASVAEHLAGANSDRRGTGAGSASDQRERDQRRGYRRGSAPDRGPRLFDQ